MIFKINHCLTSKFRSKAEKEKTKQLQTQNKKETVQSVKKLKIRSTAL